MTTIDKMQLFEILHYLHVPNQMYDLCIGDNMRLDVCDALEYTDHGWEVYTTERGSKYDIQVFDNETKACLELLRRMINECIFEKRFSDFARHQLHSILIYLKVPEELYDFSGDMTKTGAYSIEWTEQGWEEYRIENGRKHSIAVFSSQTDACLDLLWQVIHL